MGFTNDNDVAARDKKEQLKKLIVHLRDKAGAKPADDPEAMANGLLWSLGINLHQSMKLPSAFLWILTHTYNLT